MKTPYQIGEGYEDEVVRNCVIWEVKQRDQAIHTLLRDIVNDYVANMEAHYPDRLVFEDLEAIQESGRYILTLIDELFSDKTDTK